MSQTEKFQSTAYGILSAERSDGTEGLVFAAPFLTMSGRANTCGISYVLAAAKQYKTYRFWARDFVLLFPGIGGASNSEIVGAVEEWLKSYHQVGASVSLSAGALQAGIFVEFDSEDCSTFFGDPEIYLEGPNGLLPNLDLPNTLVMIERHRAGNMRLCPKESFWHRIWTLAPGNYLRSVVHATGMLFRQAFGYPNYSHGPALKYSIDSITIAYRAIPKGDESEFADRSLFEVPELAFRSLSNILEHLHQSFFFYILTGSENYVSIANYIAIGALPIIALLLSFLVGPFGEFTLASVSVTAVVIANAFCVWGFSKIEKMSVRLIVINLPSVLMLLLPVRMGAIRPIVCLLGALSLTALIFLNFGMAVFLGLFYAPLLVFPRKHRVWMLLTTCLSPTAVFTVLFFLQHDYVQFLANRLGAWNAGIPFLLWQPLILLSNKYTLEQKFHLKQE